MLRIISVTPKSLKGKTVIVKYYDTQTNEIFTKEDEWEYITPSKEIILQDYSYTPDSITLAMQKKLPGRIQIKYYGIPKGHNGSNYDEERGYLQEKTIIWHFGNREDKKTIEFFIDEEKKEQILIKNSSKRFLARSVVLNKEELELKKISLEKTLQKIGISPQDITINNSKQFIEVKCEQSQLAYLSKLSFRTNAYVSKQFEKIEEAQNFAQTIKNLEDYHIYGTQIKVLTKRDEKRKEKHYVKLLTANNNNFIKKLETLSFKRQEIFKIPAYSAKEVLWDPLNLNNSHRQLRDFFPPHIPYDEKIPLIEQKNTLPNPFLHIRLENKPSQLEDAINDAFQFYTSKSAVIDIETTGYKIGNQDYKNPTGNIFMAVLYAHDKKNIYITKKAWKNEKIKLNLKENTKNVNLVLIEDEIELISSLAKDSKEYEYIIGHNFDFDLGHLSKYNNENQLLKTNKISQEVKNRITNFRRENKTSNLWMKNSKHILDTYTYTKNRIDILADNKLATIAGFKKSIDYLEMEQLINSQSAEDIQKIINYTIEDGAQTEKVVKTLLNNAVLESFATNSTIHATFNSNALKNFDEKSQRQYFMKMHTYKNRREWSSKKYLEDLNDRDTPYEILNSFFNERKIPEGVISGKLYFPSIIIDTFKDIIDRTPETRLIYTKMIEEKNPLLKTDLISKLNSFLQVPLDKIKNYIENSNLEFGKHHFDFEIFNSIKDDPNYLYDSFFSNGDYEKSRESFIFSVEYGANPKFVRKGLIVYDLTMLNYANTFAKKLEELKKVQYEAKSQKYFIGNENLGFEIGDIQAVKFNHDRIAGKLKTKNLENETFDIYLNMNKPKDELILESLEAVLTNNDIKKSICYNKILSKGTAYWNARIDEIKSIFRDDPRRSGGGWNLFMPQI